MNLVSFDLEIAEPVEGDDWKSFRPLGISCMGTMKADDYNEPTGTSYDIWQQPGRLSKQDVSRFVDTLLMGADRGDMLVTVNGLGFDFDVLAEESGRYKDCALLALHHHCDLMLLPLCTYGWPVGLQALSEGAGIAGKLKEVTLKDGSIHEGMSGADAPELWAKGEYTAVVDYLKDDIRSTLGVALTAVDRGGLQWKSKKRRSYEILLPVDDAYTPYLPTVAECLTWPVPDTSWMDNPIRREDLTAWMKA